MRIAILAPGLAYDAGAIPIRARLTGNRLLQKGHQVFGFGLKLDRPATVEANFPIETVRVRHLPRPLASLSCWIMYEVIIAFRLINLNKKIGGIDIVVSHWQTFGVAGAIVRNRTRAKWISVVQRTIYDTKKSGLAGPNFIMNKCIEFGCRYEFGYSDLVIALHRPMATEIRRHVPKTRRISIIPNGVDLNSEPYATLFRSKIPGLILYVGRLEPEKCVDTVIRGFARSALPEAKLVIVGEGALRPSLERLATHLSVSQRVTFQGNLPHSIVLNWMRRAEVFVLLSASEGMPFVMLEAMAAGCALICSDIPGNMALVNRNIAHVVSVGDFEGVALGLRRITTDPSIAERYGFQCFERAKQFAWPRIIEEEITTYENLLAT